MKGVEIVQGTQEIEEGMTTGAGIMMKDQNENEEGAETVMTTALGIAHGTEAEVESEKRKVGVTGLKSEERANLKGKDKRRKNNCDNWRN